MVRSATTLVETEGVKIAPYGILSKATHVYNESGDLWTAGITYEIEDASVESKNVSILGVDTQVSATAVNNPDNESWGFYYPFDVQASVKKSTMGNTPERIIKAAHDALDVVTQKSIEFEFWEGGIAKQLTRTNDNRWLARNTATIVNGGVAVKPRYGLGLIQEAMGNSTIGSQGTLHMPVSVAEILKGVHDHDGEGVLRTKVGTPVIAGTGYTRRGPDGTLAPAGQAWIYGTGPVSVRLGPVHMVPEKLSQAVNTSINDIEYYVDRAAAVTWSTTGLYAVLVDLTLDYA
jgi:hypothetical protein